MSREQLHLIPAPRRRADRRLFCGHCAAPPDVAPGDELRSRVCSRCGLGLVLEARSDLAPTPDDPFLVVDASQTICAVSREAERLLGVSEPEAVNRHLADFLVPADVEAPGSYGLSALIVGAATGGDDAYSIAVRPPNEFGVRHWARVGTCGPPNAALVVLAAVE